MEHFLAGQLACLEELTLLLAPNVNSYKRFVAGSFAPTDGGMGTRQPHLRAPGRRPRPVAACREPGAGRRREPVPGAGAALIAAGLHGIENELPLEPSFVGNAYGADRPQVPATLRDAAAAFAGAEVARAAFGDDVVAHYLNAARVEQAAFDAAVTDWERDPWVRAALTGPPCPASGCRPTSSTPAGGRGTAGRAAPLLLRRRPWRGAGGAAGAAAARPTRAPERPRRRSSALDGAAADRGRRRRPRPLRRRPAAGDPAAPARSRRLGGRRSLAVALDRDLPLLAVCRGLQVLNVALGGTLDQHVPDVVGHDGHRPGRRAWAAPTCTLAPGRAVAAILGRRGRRCPATTTRPSTALGRGVRGRRAGPTTGSSRRSSAPGRRFLSACSGTPRTATTPGCSRPSWRPRRGRSEPAGRANHGHSALGAARGAAASDSLNPEPPRRGASTVRHPHTSRRRAGTDDGRSPAPGRRVPGLAGGGPRRPGPAAAPVRRGRRRRRRAPGRPRGRQLGPHDRQRPLGGGQRPRRPPLLRGGSGAAVRSADPGAGRARHHLPRADRRRRRHRPLELPDADRGVGVRPGAGRRQHAWCSSRPS